MGRSAAVLAFIGICAAVGVYVAMQPTVIKGEAMAAMMMDLVDRTKITAIECDKRIPVGKHGAKFHCTLQTSTGARPRFEYTIDRSFKFTEKPATDDGPRPSGW